MNENFIYGRNPVKESLKAHKIKKVFVSDNFSDAEILSLVSKNNIPLGRISNKELENLSKGASHQGVIGICKPFEYTDLNSVIAKTKKIDKPIIVILDGIEDPHNFGAIIRSSEIFGVSAIIISKHNQVPVNATVMKTSAGALSYVPIVLAGNLSQTIKTLKEEGFWIVASDGSGEVNYADLKYDFPTVLIIGSEGKGVSPLVKKNSDYIVKIPMYGKVNSLNASVAAGILLSKIKG